jgi:HSP20 family protein
MSLTTLVRTNGLTTMLNDYLEPWNDWFTDDFIDRSVTLPKVNITEDKSNFNLSLVAPGLQKKDFKIDVDGRMLTISAENESDQEQTDETFTRREYNYESFSRSFTLPDEVLADKINATYEGGILKLAIPKSEKAIKELHQTVPVN